MQQHQWTIIEGDAPTPGAKRNMYATLWADMMLRLERTPAHRGLHIQCKDVKETKNLALGLRKHAHKLPPESVLVVQDTSACTVSVARGPNWSKRGAGELAHIGAHPADAPGTYKPPQNGSGKRRPGRPRKVREA